MCFKRKKEKHEWVYVLDGCQVRVVFAPKVWRELTKKGGAHCARHRHDTGH